MPLGKHRGASGSHRCGTFTAFCAEGVPNPPPTHTRHPPFRPPAYPASSALIAVVRQEHGPLRRARWRAVGGGQHVGQRKARAGAAGAGYPADVLQSADPRRRDCAEDHGGPGAAGRVEGVCLGMAGGGGHGNGQEKTRMWIGDGQRDTRSKGGGRGSGTQGAKEGGKGSGTRGAKKGGRGNRTRGAKEGGGAVGHEEQRRGEGQQDEEGQGCLEWRRC
eukprot:355667-Chlamydomonas_euryale.AAC.6